MLSSIYRRRIPQLGYAFSLLRASQTSRAFTTTTEPEKIIEIIYSDKTDIHFNLATEEYFFEHSNLKYPTLFLWRNDRNVVIGESKSLSPRRRLNHFSRSSPESLEGMFSARNGKGPSETLKKENWRRSSLPRFR
jgi:hypothetical protein